MVLLPGIAKRARVCEEIDDGYRLQFAASSELLRAIVEMIDAERQCCRFLRFGLTVESGDEGVVLDVTGPAGTKAFLADIFAR
jgi:hypothetical protein